MTVSLPRSCEILVDKNSSALLQTHALDIKAASVLMEAIVRHAAERAQTIVGTLFSFSGRPNGTIDPPPRQAQIALAADYCPSGLG